MRLLPILAQACAASMTATHISPSPLRTTIEQLEAIFGKQQFRKLREV